MVGQRVNASCLKHNENITSINQSINQPSLVSILSNTISASELVFLSFQKSKASSLFHILFAKEYLATKCQKLYKNKHMHK